MVRHGMRRWVERTLSEYDMPAVRPAHGPLLADRDGHLWVAEYPSAGEPPTRWRILDRDGRWLGTVNTPPGLRLTYVARNYIVGVFTDDLGVEQVRAHRLVR